MVSVDYDDTQQSQTLPSTPAQKRKLGETGFEIADSDEEYGWDDDEDLPPMPSQWQGSEDILLVRQPESDQGDQEDEDTVALESEDRDADDPGSDAGGPDANHEP